MLKSNGAVYDPELASNMKYAERARKYRRAQMGEDMYLYEHFFYGKKNGVMVESGALDGMLYSTTLMFEHYFDWLGVHIEGNIGHYKELIINRPDSVNINAALSNETKTYHYLSHKKPSPVDGIIEFMDEPSIKRFHKMYALRRSDPEAAKEYLTEVHGLPFKVISHELHIKHIDCWVLDVEGGELAVLQGVDFDTLTIDVIIVETMKRLMVSAVKNDVIDFLSSKGYTCETFLNNEACWRPGFVRSVKPSIVAKMKNEKEKE